nr:MAG TPA: hypothetical protein [Caudoviricetes sp.]DAG16732.1 MAG TPA: hypothetical protein [Caudoviricetes sp.]
MPMKPSSNSKFITIKTENNIITALMQSYAI